MTLANKAQKIRVGMFVIVTAVLLGIVLVVFGGLRVWGSRDHYHVEVDESVYGLAEGAKVYLDGIPVGSVTDIAIAKHDLRKVDVTIEVESGTPVRVDTRALLQHAGITGLKEIDLRGGTLAAAPLPVGGTIAQGETAIDELERTARTIADRSTELMASAQRLVDNLVALSDPADYAAMLRDARTTAANLAAASASLSTMIGENRTALRRSIEAVHATAQSASEILDGQVAQLVAGAGEVVTDLRGLVRDNEGSLRAAVADLRTASRSFKDLAREVRQKPSRLLYGGTASDRKLP